MSIVHTELPIATAWCFDSQCHAENHSYPIPQSVQTAWAMKQALGVLSLAARDVTPSPLPAKPTDLAKALDKAASTAAAEAQRADIVTRWNSQGDLAYIEQVRAAVPAWTDALAADFLREADAFRALDPARFTHTDVRRLPVGMFADYQQMVAHVEQLERFVSMRKTFAAAGREHRPAHANQRSITAQYGDVHYALVVQTPTGDNYQSLDRQHQHRHEVLATANSSDIIERWTLWAQAVTDGWATMTMPTFGHLNRHLELTEMLYDFGASLQSGDSTSLAAMMHRSDSTYTDLTGGVAQLRQYDLAHSNRVA